MKSARHHLARLALVALLPLSILSAQGIDDGREAYRTGKYASAISTLAKISPNDSDWVDAQRLLVRALTTIGKYDEAEATARRATAAKGGDALWNTLGEVLVVRGKRAPAESAFTVSVGMPTSRPSRMSAAARAMVSALGRTINVSGGLIGSIK